MAYRTLKKSPHITSAVCEALPSIIRNYFSVTCGTILLKKVMKPILNKKFTKNELFATIKNIYNQRFQCFSWTGFEKSCLRWTPGRPCRRRPPSPLLATAHYSGKADILVGSDGLVAEWSMIIDHPMRLKASELAYKKIHLGRVLPLGAAAPSHKVRCSFLQFPLDHFHLLVYVYSVSKK